MSARFGFPGGLFRRPRQRRTRRRWRLHVGEYSPILQPPAPSVRDGICLCGKRLEDSNDCVVCRYRPKYTHEARTSRRYFPAPELTRIHVPHCHNHGDALWLNFTISGRGLVHSCAHGCTPVDPVFLCLCGLAAVRSHVYEYFACPVERCGLRVSVHDTCVFLLIARHERDGSYLQKTSVTCCDERQRLTGVSEYTDGLCKECVACGARVHTIFNTPTGHSHHGHR
jgi:hypothetical protein